MAVKSIAIALCIMLLCSSCTGMPLAANGDLLAAPILSSQQADVSEALQRILNLSDIIYKYPSSGDYRSSFLFYDLDNDGLQEAIVLYAHAFAPTEIRAKILRQSEQGEWFSFADIAGSGDEIDFISFAPIHQSEHKSMVIGWRDSAYQQTYLGIYTMRDLLETDFYDSYSAFVLNDFDDNGISELVTAKKQDNVYMLNFLKAAHSRLIMVDSKPLFSDATNIMQMMHGRLWDNSPGIYVDERIDNTFYGTEVFRVTGNSLIPISSGSADSTSPLWQNFSATFRDTNILSTDIAGDGAVEVPRIEDLPGAFDVISAELEPPPLIKYMRLENDSFHVRFNAVVNSDAGYMVFYPERWLENVTLVESSESKEWSFRKYDEEQSRIGAELLRIRVYSIEDFFDSNSDEFLLANRGLYLYYGYIPPTAEDEELAVSQPEVLNLFALL